MRVDRIRLRGLRRSTCTRQSPNFRAHNVLQFIINRKDVKIKRETEIKSEAIFREVEVKRANSVFGIRASLR